MKVVLILVVFTLGEGSDLVTTEFATMAECEAGALAMFKDVNNAHVANRFELTAGSDVIEETMIVRGQDGTDIGMFSCGPLRVVDRNGE